MAKGAARVVGIFLGSLLGLAVGLNGDLLNNPYFATCMVALLTALFRCGGAACLEEWLAAALPPIACALLTPALNRPRSRRPLCAACPRRWRSCGTRCA